MTERSCAIVGVVGSTISTGLVDDSELDDAQRALLQQAQAVGALIARERQVVLTGGHHKRVEASVKYRALVGALDAGTETEPARVIGILPVKISATVGVGEVAVKSVTTGSPRSVYVHTQLKPAERNPLTGSAPDVLIALEGGKGTAQEVSAACKVDRPVVFLSSSHRLRPLLTCVPRRSYDAETPDEAVAKALDAIGLSSSSPRLDGRFPDHFEAYADPAVYPRLKADYEGGLRDLSP
jgi:predicted Rossmann-fold nucleotide-binding protein